MYETDRLILRNWVKSDINLFAQMNADPAVMEYFPATKTRQESEEILARAYAQIEQNGFGFWAAVHKDSNQLIGSIGLNHYNEDLPFCPCVEMGWRLHKSWWGKGYATEGANKCLEIGFNRLSLTEVFAFTAINNQRSRNVMTRVGMLDTRRNFQHPAVSAKSGLREQCLYRITQEQWNQSVSNALLSRRTPTADTTRE